MKVFLPFINKYTYLNEIEKFSDFQFEKNHFLKYDDSFKIINIHWPEAIFNWKEPSNSELDQLEKEIANWKKHSKLVYTKHDLERVKGTTPNFKRLFRIIEKNTDLFIHLGDYSKKLYKVLYPETTHIVIPHPCFEQSFEKIPKQEARNRLGIDKEALVIIAPGQVRTFKERKLILDSFKKIKEENKVLIATNMLNELKYDFRGRVKMQRFFDVQQYLKMRFRKKYQPPEYLFTYESISSNDFSIRLSAADIVLVPRTDLLNSGNVLLGLSFGKVTVGPAIGNIEQQLVDHKLPLFDPNSITSVVEALEQGIEMYKKGIFPKPLEKYLPENVAKEYDRVFKELLKE
ncbi:hypothetical protein NE848_07440 [Gramella jeungdoensis]|uniref:Glycosyltransferase n=1 Tax=Gramella jeungdoensis TaxID=708091 RepID=A0ABT0Z0G4_9FLAO|nr:hypothetical protein [Gramella jeungdoensis]MCM8569206.1 hypothetical protein [Gramella jeungdoensis]